MTDVYILKAKERFTFWIKERQGVKVWASTMGNKYTPAIDKQGKEYTLAEDDWHYTCKETVTDISEFNFLVGYKEFKKIRFSAIINGSEVKITPSSIDRINRWMKAARSRHYGEPRYRFENNWAIIEIPVFEGEKP